MHNGYGNCIQNFSVETSKEEITLILIVLLVGAKN